MKRALFLFLLVGLSAVPAVAQQGPRIADVEVLGATTIDPQRIQALSGLTVGRSVSLRLIQESIRTLWKSNLFNDVEITSRRHDGVGPDIDLIVQVEEAPVINEIRYEGSDKVKESDLRGKIGINRGDRLLDHRLFKGKVNLEEYYHERGFFLAEVNIVPASPGADSTAIVVEIDEGRKVSITGIQFVGNDAFSDGTLRDALDTEKKGSFFMFWKDGEFDEDKWRVDLAQRLPRFYGEHGYLDMRVVGDSLAVNPESGTMDLFVTVEEGEQYRTGDITIEGNSRFSRADLRRYVELVPGQVFDTKAVSKSQEEMLNLYADDGYIYAQVQPVQRPRSEEKVVDLMWQIREGNPAHVRHVRIVGNTVTHESVIRRQLFIRPGQRFRRTDVRNSLLSLEGLGFFEPGIFPQTEVVDQRTGDIDLTFEVKEKRTGSLSLGAAVGGGTGLSGFVGYEQPNLFGQAKSGRIRFEFGARNTSIELGYTEPLFLGSRTSMSVSFFNLDQNFINTSQRQKALGGAVSFSSPAPWGQATRLLYGYRLQEIDLESTIGDDDRFRDQYPRTESSVNVGIVRDTRLPRVHPIQGARHRIVAELAGGPLGGTVGFQKYEFETSWFAPTYGDRMALNLLAKTGGINPGVFVPDPEQFLLGGVQLPARGLRGYAANCVGIINRGNPIVPCGADRGNAYVLLTAEHFFKITDTIWVSAFYDAGAVWRQYRDVNFSDLLRGAGVGIQIDLPGFGPLGLDYGYGFDRLNRVGDADPGWELAFRFGQIIR